MRNSAAYLVLCLVVVVVVAVVLPEEATVKVNAVTCNPTELSPCAASLATSLPPSPACCNKLREQRPCLCGYKRDPNLNQYVDSAAAQKVSSDCGVSVRC
ncbi:hypothetical protein Ancab_006349 [Ancistrocladus abbreviatus]